MVTFSLVGKMDSIILLIEIRASSTDFKTILSRFTSLILFHGCFFPLST